MLFMILRGQLFYILCDINPQYQKYVIYKRDKKVLYFHVIQFIYELIEASLLWYDFYKNTLEDIGAKLNSYGRYVANK